MISIATLLAALIILFFAASSISNTFEFLVTLSAPLVTIKLQQNGRRNKKGSSLVAVAKTKGKTLTKRLAHVDFLKYDNNEYLVVKIDFEQLGYFLSKGPRVTRSAEKLLSLNGLFYLFFIFFLLYIQLVNASQQNKRNSSKFMSFIPNVGDVVRLRVLGAGRYAKTEGTVEKVSRTDYNANIVILSQVAGTQVRVKVPVFGAGISLSLLNTVKNRKKV